MAPQPASRKTNAFRYFALKEKNRVITTLAGHLADERKTHDSRTRMADAEVRRFPRKGYVSVQQRVDAGRNGDCGKT